MLPELPVPGPTPHGNPNPGSNLLYHRSLVDEASQLLANPNPALTAQLSTLLGSTSVDYIELNERNVALNSSGQAAPLPQNNLVNAIYQQNPSVFGGGSNSAVQHQQWQQQQQLLQPQQQQQLPNNTNFPQQNSFGTDGGVVGNAAAAGLVDPSASGGVGYNANYLQQQQYVGQDQQQQQMAASGYSGGNDQKFDPQPDGGYNQQQQQMGQQQHQQDINSGVQNDPSSYQQPQQQQQPPQRAPHVISLLGNRGGSGGGGTAGNQQQQSSSQAQQLQTSQQQQMPPPHGSNGNMAEIKTDEIKVDPGVGGAGGGMKMMNMPMIKLNKLSKEAEEMMMKNVNSLKKKKLDGEQREELGVYDQFTPRSQRSRGSASDRKYDVGSSESEDDEKDSKKGRNKFFKATEKERDDEMRKLKDERRRKRRNDEDGGEFEPENFGKRRRTREPTPEPEISETFVPKKVTRKLERKLIPLIPMINCDELLEDNNTFKRFNKTVELIFDKMEDINMNDFDKDEHEDTEIPTEILIPRYQLTDLAAETAKLKSLGVMESISSERLVKLLNILELNIRDGAKVVPLPSGDDEDEEDDRLWLEIAMERVTRAADASLSVLNVITSKGMPKRVYIDDVIDRVALFLRFQLSNTIYPSYDPVYKEISKSKTGYVGNMKKKRTYAHGPRNKSILGLYNKVHDLTSMLADLVKMQLLTDTTILHISTLGVAPFFVENIPELQLAALKLVTNLFSKYEKHRKLLLDDILASIARLPSSKRSLRTYRLNVTTHIQMLTALVLQLIQCVVCLPRKLALKVAEKDKISNNKKKDPGGGGEVEVLDADGAPIINQDMDRDVLINNKYNMAMGTAHQFLTVFLKKCGSKNEDIDYRPLFENFVQDLLTTVNTPEWPAAELLLSLLGRVLREKFKDRSTEMALRISSLEYLGVVAARLRKDAVQSKMKVDYIDSIIQIIKDEENKDKGDSSSADLMELDPETGQTVKKKSSKKKSTRSSETVDPEDERSMFLQRVLLDYLAVNGGEDDQATINARHFYICQWYRDVNAIGRKPKKYKKPKPPQNKKRGRAAAETSSEESEESEEEENDMNDAKKAELFRLKETRKDFLVVKIPPFGISKGNKAQVLSTHIDHSSAHLIVQYLSSKRPFFNSFNYYLQDIITVLGEQSTQIRTKALKCMTMIVTEDPEVLLRKDMRAGVHTSFMDQSTMVREAAVDLVGKFILHKQDLITQYYDIITERILVRKTRNEKTNLIDYQ